MAEITAAAIKDLREKTQAGMMDCKKALTECKGDMEEAIDWLRKKGLSAAAKKSGRIAAEGLVGVTTNGSETEAAVVEINTETDFAAKNEKFQALLSNVTKLALQGSGDVEELKKKAYPGKSNDVAQEVAELVGVIGENIQLRRSAKVSGDVVVSYLHNAVNKELGKIGVLVALKSSGNKEKLKALGKQIAMHVAANRPESLNVADLDPKLVERERSILTEQARASGKPDNVIEKMIEGRIQKFYAEVVLVEQAFVMDGKTPIREVLKEAAKDIGGEVTIASYVRFMLGEGIEKKEENFADEVAKAANA